jgi:hypothetical protein
MAGLKKPEICLVCQSKELHRELHPERWVCAVGHVVVSRSPKPQTGICRGCGRAKSDEVPFKDGKNQCMDCYNEYMRNWGDKNHEARCQYKRDYYAENKTEIRAKSNAYWQGSVEAFISDLWRRSKRVAWERFGKKNRVLSFEITKEYLLDLYKQQNGICPLSKLRMKHQWGSLYSISVDRIDSALGYVPGNVQLVTKAANLLKNEDTQAEALAYFDAVRQTSISTISEIPEAGCSGDSDDKSGTRTASGEDQADVDQAALPEVAQTPS